jgi:integrase/recombinase XerD
LELIWQGDCGSYVKKNHDTTLTASASVEGSSNQARKALAQARLAAALALYPSLLRLHEALILDSSSGTKRDEYLRYGLRIAQWAKADPADITQDQVTAFFIELKVGGRYAANTIRLMTAALRYLFLKVLRREGWDIFLKLRSPDVKRLPFVLSVPQCQALIAHTRLAHFRLLWQLILGTGLRISEAVGLELSSIRGKDTATQSLVVLGKGNKERCIPLPPLLYQKLRDYWTTHRHPRWVFPSPMEQRRVTQASVPIHASAPMSPQAAQSAIKAIALEAKLPAELGCHTLRHTYATLALEAGVNLMQVSAYLGHNSLETTLIYLHLTPSSEAHAVALMEQRLQQVLRPERAL